jgi:hypothetical protein
MQSLHALPLLCPRLFLPRVRLILTLKDLHPDVPGGAVVLCRNAEVNPQWN